MRARAALTALPALLIALSLPACVSTHAYEADISLLQPYACEDCPKFPFAAEYRRAGRRLTYVAALHQSGLDSETFQLIRLEFERLSPQIVIVEGIPHGAGPNHPAFVQEVAANAAHLESYYAASLALGAHALFMGGEPPPGEIKDALLLKGYTQKDILGFTLLLETPVWKRMARGESFGDFFRRNVQEKSRMYRLDAASAMTEEEFRVWHRHRNGRDFDPEKVSIQDTSPQDALSALFTQRMDLEMARVRDTRICRVIADALTRHTRVLVVYGGGHFGSQRAVFERLMGKPTFSRL